MGQILTLMVLALVCAFILFKVMAANRRARLARERAEEEAGKRREREKEILERLGRIREKKDDLQAAKDVIAKDPKRAAKVLSKMMRSKD